MGPSLKEDVKTAFQLLKETYTRWSRSNASFLAAGLAYFAVFSLLPILVLAIATAGFILGEKAAQGALVTQISGITGEQVAKAIQEFLASARQPGIGKATVFSIILLLAGASKFFGQLQIALNIIWGIPPSQSLGMRRAVLSFLKKRLISFALVLSIGVFLIASTLVDAALELVKSFMGSYLPFLDDLNFWKVLNFVVSVILLGLLTSAIYYFLPDTRIAWGTCGSAGFSPRSSFPWAATPSASISA